MIRLDDRTLRELQLTELDLLLEVDRIAKKHGIQYRIIAGTMLGAVRHGGFIPWDDDADVAMPRGDYERFTRACATELDSSKYCFQDHRSTEGYRWGYGKLRRRGTLFLRENQEDMPYEQGVFIDVFPLDPVPDSRAGRFLVNIWCFFIRKALWSRVGKRADKSAVKRAVYRALDRIPLRSVLGAYERLIARLGKIDSKWVRILMFPTPNSQYGYLREWYSVGRDIMFEGHVFSGVSDADGYLSFKYGDYMTPAAVSERKTHAVTRLTLPDEQTLEVGKNDG